MDGRVAGSSRSAFNLDGWHRRFTTHQHRDVAPEACCRLLEVSRFLPWRCYCQCARPKLAGRGFESVCFRYSGGVSRNLLLAIGQRILEGARLNRE